MSFDTRPILYCFRNDLRLRDNPGFQAACTSGRPVQACFVFDDRDHTGWGIGGASRWWLHHSLQALGDELNQLGGRLILRSGCWSEQVIRLAREVGAYAVYVARAYDRKSLQDDSVAGTELKRYGIEARRFGGYLLHEPSKIRNTSNDPFKVFTPFWKACLKQPEPSPPLPLPESIDFFATNAESEALESWNLLPHKPDWAAGLRKRWVPGESAGLDALDRFLDCALTDYPQARDYPARDGTSALSPYLHFGEISPRQIWHATRQFASSESRLESAKDAFLRELGWREFSYHLLCHWPDLPEQPFRPEYSEFPWREDADLIRRWQQGQTGIPIIDAGMRELWSSGWMHNRVRMLVASLLVKNMLQPWQAGEAWFWDTLVDADLANNAASWQWVAGCGADAAPYFRIFNPVTQSEKFDPDGVYIRRWVPELEDLSGCWIHAPWCAPNSELQEAGVVLGQNYPRPIVDLAESRRSALELFKELKGRG